MSAIDDTLQDMPGIELDAEMAQRIMENGDDYSEHIATLARFIHHNRARFRKRLLDQGLIQSVSQDAVGFDLAAVDGASAVSPHGGGALVVAAAYKATINDDKQRAAAHSISVPNHVNVEMFATLLRIHLELSLLTIDKLDEDQLVVLDHSFWGILQQVSRALAVYKRRRRLLVDLGLDLNGDALLGAWQTLFRECLGTDGSFLRMIRNKQVISLSKTGVSQYLVNLLLPGAELPEPPPTSSGSLSGESYVRTLGTSLNDRALLRHVLEPGEYTTPRSLYETVKEGGSVKSWQRSRFATDFDPKEDGPNPFESRHAVLDEYGIPRDDNAELVGKRLFVSYYWPHRWSRVYRIEFHELMLANRDKSLNPTGHGERFGRVLAAVRHSVSPETKEPLCQVLADRRAKAATATATSVLPERAFYQLRDQYRDTPDMLGVIDTLLDEERT